MPVLRSLSIPQLWILAGDDSEAPPGETMRRLRALAGEGRPITTMVFPGTDHGIVAFETGADGKRSETRYAEGYLRMRSEEHTSELQSLMRISYAVFCLKKNNKRDKQHTKVNDKD